MHDRIVMMQNIAEVIGLVMFNLFAIISLSSVIGVISALITIIYSLGRIKRDVVKYHNGEWKGYLKFLFNKAKKN